MLEGRYSTFAHDTEALEVQYTFLVVLQCKDKFGMDADSINFSVIGGWPFI